MKVNLICNIFGADGFSSHGKQLANAMHEAGIEVRIDCPKPQGWERNVSDSEYLMLTREFSEDMTSILIGTPQYLPLIWAENPKNTIIFLIWEGDKVPEYWLDNLMNEKTNQIWVPSQHVKSALFMTIAEDKKWENFEKKIKIIPHGVDLSLFNCNKKIIKTENEPFVFLVNKGWRGTDDDRGGVQYVLKAYTEEFTKEDNVRLICKINPSYLPYGFDFKYALERIGIEKKENTPMVAVSLDNIPYQMMPEIYKDADVYVNPCRAEGFGLPGLEAHAMGIPTIQTNFGGQIDYMTSETDFYLIAYKLEEVTNDVMYEGIRWAIPNISELKIKMRYAYNNRKQFEKMGLKASENAKDWSWRKTAEEIKVALGELND